MTDPYGVPNNFCGVVPEEFYAVVGRVAVLAALVELELYYVARVLDRAKPQDTHAGKPVAQLLTEVRRLLSDHDAALREAGDDLLDRTKTTLDDRNAVVHGLWVGFGSGKPQAWRPVRPGKQLPEGEYIAWHDPDKVQFIDLIRRLVQLVEDLVRFRDRANSAMNRRDAGL